RPCAARSIADDEIETHGDALQTDGEHGDTGGRWERRTCGRDRPTGSDPVRERRRTGGGEVRAPVQPPDRARIEAEDDGARHARAETRDVGAAAEHRICRRTGRDRLVPAARGRIERQDEPRALRDGEVEGYREGGLVLGAAIERRAPAGGK